MDLTKTVGNAGVPLVIFNSTAGSAAISEQTDYDIFPLLHACLMTVAFLDLMPMGILVLRVLNSPKWHGINQTISTALGLIGTLLAIYIGFMYNRSKSLNSAHQIFGLIITAATIAQFVLGFMHHCIYKETLALTKLALYHIWLGRLVIPAGVANAFLGFPLALNSHCNYVLMGFVILVFIIMLPFIFWKRRNFSRVGKKAPLDEPIGRSDFRSRPREASDSSTSDIRLN